MSIEHYRWRLIAAGEIVPSDAVPAGETKKDGKMWIGRLDGGQVGKVCGKLYSGGSVSMHHGAFVMECFKHHGSSWGESFKRCEILCCPSQDPSKKVGTHTWYTIKRGDPLPQHSMHAGSTSTDGETFVGRAVDGEPGKINTDKNKMHSLWVHSAWSGAQEAHILVIPPVVAVTATAVARPVAAETLPLATATAVARPVAASTLPVATATAVATGKGQPQPKYPPVKTAPDVPRPFLRQELNKLSEAELAHLQANPSSMNDWIESLPPVMDHTRQRQELWDSEAELAKGVVDKENLFRSACTSSEQSIEALRRRQAQVQTLSQEQDRVRQQHTPQEMHRILQSRANHASDIADERLQQICMGSAALDAQSLADFRSLYIQRKTEKHAQLALGQQLAGGTSG
jgi:hypothetical protein